jgi:hypothetical protein
LRSPWVRRWHSPKSQSGDTVPGPPAPRAKHKPIDLDIEAPFFNFTQDLAKFLNDLHDDYCGLKKELRRDYDLHHSMLILKFPQWDRPALSSDAGAP